MQNEIVDYVHSKSLKVFIDGYNLDDVFGTAVVNEVSYTTGYYANTLSSVQMNPQGVAARLGPADIYLLEHFQVINGTFEDPQSWTSRSDKAYAYKLEYGARIATITTQADVSPPEADCSLLFDENKFDYAWWSTLLYGFDFMAWGEPSGFSSWGTCSNALPFHVRPNLGDIGEYTATVTHPLPNDAPVHYRDTTVGSIEIDTGAHTGRFLVALPVNRPPLAVNDSLTTTMNTPVNFTASHLLQNDSDPDANPLSISSISATTNGGTVSGSYIYTPPSGFTGTDSFTYTISDGQGGTASATVTVTVNATGITPSKYFPQAITILTGKFDWGTLSSFTAADGNTYDVKSIYVKASAGGEADWYGKTVMTGSPSAVSQLTMTYKGQYSKARVTQQIYLYNFSTISWDLVDTRSVGNIDDVAIIVTISSNPQRYISAKGEIRARVKGFRAGAKATKNWAFYSWANYLSWDVK